MARRVTMTIEVDDFVVTDSEIFAPGDNPIWHAHSLQAAGRNLNKRMQRLVRARFGERNSTDTGREYLLTEGELLKAAKRYVEIQDSDDDGRDPHHGAAMELAHDDLALAARALVERVNMLPENQQPVGW